MMTKVCNRGENERNRASFILGLNLLLLKLARGFHANKAGLLVVVALRVPANDSSVTS